MHSTKKKAKLTKELKYMQETESSGLSSESRRNDKKRYKNISSFTEEASSSAYTEPSGSRISEKGQLRNSSSLFEGLTSSAYTGESGSSSNEKRKLKDPSSFMKGTTSSVYTDPSESRADKRGRYRNPSSSMQDATSSAYSNTSRKTEDEKGLRKNTKNLIEGVTSSVYTVNTPGASFQTTGIYSSELPSDTLNSDQSGATTSYETPREPKENVRLMPFKIKDVMEMIKDNPTYKDKSPVMIKVKENDIDQILQRQNAIRGKAEPLEEYLQHPKRGSPVSLPRSLKGEMESFRMSTGAEGGKSKISRESPKKLGKPRGDDTTLAGADRTQKIFAMPDIQAFPVVQARASRSRRRSRSRRVSPTPRRRVSRRRVSRPPRYRSRHPVYARRRAVRRPYRRPYVSPCTVFPMCDDECPMRRVRRRPYMRRVSRPRPVISTYNTPYYSGPRRVGSTAYNTPYYAESTPRVVASRGYNTPFTSSSRGLYYPERSVTPIRSRRITAAAARGNCCCNMCEEKLQFIQPGLCTKKKNVWTNEYAIIPKPEVNLIDPCEELDPSIYPRADNPCIRDSQGNPLTDCIGRPLRSPIGKKFLSFTANGSVMDTKIRGNFWTGQPPLCVKCPMPSGTCGPDNTHNWWMSCGYPIMPNMNPFYKRVIAAEMGPC